MSKRLDQLFDVFNGIAASSVEVENDRLPGYIPFLRPSKTSVRSIAGWVDPESVPARRIFPADTLYVSTNGEGSHTYSYVCATPFVANSDVAVLIPKQEMTLHEKNYYATCITANRPLFSYGRKPKGERLASMPLPEKVPDWVYRMSEPSFEDFKVSASPVKTDLPSMRYWAPFALNELFEIKKGSRLTKSQQRLGSVPYLGASAQNNSVTAFIDAEPQFPGNVIAVPYNGSTGYATYQPVPFLAGDDVHVLIPKKETLPPLVQLFLCTLIRHEGNRYSYGRKWNLERMNEDSIMVPARFDTSDGKPIPDWELIENYMRSLEYSSGALP